MLISEQQAAEMLCTTPGTLRARRSERRTDRQVAPIPPYVKIGRRVLYDLRDLEAFIAEHRVVTSEGAAV